VEGGLRVRHTYRCGGRRLTGEVKDEQKQIPVLHYGISVLYFIVYGVIVYFYLSGE